MPNDGAARLPHVLPAMQQVPASVRLWLIVVAGMIFFMIVIGALTSISTACGAG